jgi:hypothetical protein
MEDYEHKEIDGTYQTTAPWNAYREDIVTVVIREGVTSIGDAAFAGCRRLIVPLTLPNSVITIGEDTFYGCGVLAAIGIPHSVSAIGEGTFADSSDLGTVTNHRSTP